MKPASIKTVEIEAVKAPLVAGGTFQLAATTRTFSGDPRTDVPVAWTSDKPSVATIDVWWMSAAGVGTANIKATAQGARVRQQSPSSIEFAWFGD